MKRENGLKDVQSRIVSRTEFAKVQILCYIIDVLCDLADMIAAEQ
jgi:hypothetical protein